MTKRPASSAEVKTCHFCQSEDVRYGVYDGFMFRIYLPACTDCVLQQMQKRKTKEIVDAVAIWPQRIGNA